MGFGGRTSGSSVNIYNSNGTYGSTRDTTLTDHLKFIVPSIAGSSGVKIGLVSIQTAASTLYVHNVSVSQFTTLRSFDNNNNNTSIRLLNGSGVDTGSLRNGGSWILALLTTSTVSIGTNLSSTTKLLLRGTGATSATINQRWEDSSGTTLAQLNDNGHIGFGATPSAGDRIFVSNMSGKDGAINILASNLNNNGYSILAQGGLGVAGTYNGIWSDANGGATVDNKAFFGIAGYNGVQNNYGAEFRARQGSVTSIGVWGRALGGDSVVPGFAAVGVQGSVESVVATNRRAGYFYSLSDVNNGTTYGVKSEVTAQGTNAVNYGIHSRVNGNGATVTNYAGYFQADGGTGATNIAIYSAAGNVVLVGLPTYADDAAAGAGGLPANYVYKTATGELRIKL